jgi:hypothetical protein
MRAGLYFETKSSASASQARLDPTRAASVDGPRLLTRRAAGQEQRLLRGEKIHM